MMSNPAVQHSTAPAIHSGGAAIDPRIAGVEFRVLVPRVDSDGRTGGHPLLEGDAFRYTR